MRLAFIRHGPLLVATLAFALAGIAAQHMWAPEYAYNLTWWAFPSALVAFVFGIILAMSVHVLVFITPSRPLALLRKQLADVCTRQRLANWLPVFVVTGLFFAVFARMKSLIGVFLPFPWDSFFAELDIWLHGGMAPWRLLAPILLNGPAVTVITVLYNYIWHVLCYSMLAYVTLQPISRERMRFLWAFFGCWALIGVLAASLFSSAGPAYYERLLAQPGQFQGLLERLYALGEQGPWLTPQPFIELLWQARQMPGGPPPGLGISAMPSMHVAMSMLFYLYARHHGARAQLLAGGYLIVTLLGSVILAWHYAVDGYLAIVMTLAIWWLADKLAGWDMKRISRLPAEADTPSPAS